jgi:hypothetical protein
MKYQVYVSMREFIRDLIAEPERMSDPDMREKTLFEAQELLDKADGKKS